MTALLNEHGGLAEPVIGRASARPGDFAHPCIEWPSSSPTIRLRDLAGGKDYWSIREHLPAIVDQILQSVRRNVQGGSIHRILVASRRLGALGLQDLVNLV